MSAGAPPFAVFVATIIGAKVKLIAKYIAGSARIVTTASTNRSIAIILFIPTSIETRMLFPYHVCKASAGMRSTTTVRRTRMFVYTNGMNCWNPSLNAFFAVSPLPLEKRIYSPAFEICAVITSPIRPMRARMLVDSIGMYGAGDA